VSESIQTVGLFRKTRDALRLRGPLAADPTAKVLHALLIGSLIWMIFNIGVILPFVTPAKALSIPIDLLLLLIFISAWVFLERGSMRTASLVYVGGMWIVMTFIAVVSGTIHSPALLFYIALPISAAWLLGYWAAIWFAAVGLLSTLAMVVMDLSKVIPPSYFPNKAIGVWSDVLYATVIATVPAAQVLKILKEALAASQRDIMERTRAEKEVRKHQEHLEELVAERTVQLVEARDLAEAANHAKTTFLANMSHELRTPLNAILGFSNLLRESGRIPEKERRDLDVINRSGEHLLSLINQVLDMAKIDAGRIVVEKTPLDLTELVSGVMDLMRMRAEEKGLEISLREAPESCRFVEGDGEKLRQVLINLVGNAVKYTERGNILLRVGCQSAQDAQHCTLVMEVQDSGIGIGSQDQVRIFDPFVQAGALHAQKGTGLGLAICRKFVELMGGTIRLVRSAPGKGSLFRVEIPVEKVERSEMPARVIARRQISGIESGQPEFRILIVEDQGENWLLLHRLLDSVGFQSQVAEEGAAAVDMFLAWRPHLIWMDWRLPGMDGLEVTRRIRQLDGGRDVKIVILSAFAFTEYRDEALAAGVDDFVGKPFQADEIFDCMARHLSVRYLYRAVVGAPPAGSVEALRSEALAVLPEQLREELADAVVRLDAGPISEVIERVSRHDAQLSRVLSNYAERFAFTEILIALENSNGLVRKEGHDRQS
jgi:signal transduction histidine kinase/DNA-binding response OmpR family regulator